MRRTNARDRARESSPATPGRGARHRAPERRRRRCSSPAACSRSRTVCRRRPRRIDSGARRRRARCPGSRCLERRSGGGDMTTAAAGPARRRSSPPRGESSRSARRSVRCRRWRASRRGRRAATRSSGAVSRATRAGEPRVIAECKRRSPSKGILRARLRSRGARARVRGSRGGGDFGADRADVFRRLARAPPRGASGRRHSGPAEGLHRLRISADRSRGARRGCRTADRRGARPARAHVAAAGGSRTLGLAALVEVHDRDGDAARASTPVRESSA